MSTTSFDTLMGSPADDSFGMTPEEQSEREGVVILDPGDDRAQKVGKAIASATAGDILHAFGEGPMTLTEVSESLTIPINTAKYHVQNLVDADLLDVIHEKYSVKGRKIKVYALKDQVLIVAPKSTNVRSLLLKYASLFVVAIAATVTMFIANPLFMLSAGSEQMMMKSGAPQEAADAVRNATPALAEEGVGEEFGTLAANATAVNDAAAAPNLPPPVPHPDAGVAAVPGLEDLALAFLLGACVVIAALVIYEWYQRRRG